MDEVTIARIESIVERVAMRRCSKCLSELPATREFFQSNGKKRPRLKYACKGCTNTNAPRRKVALSMRFWRHVQKSDGDGCWVWTGAHRDPDGYGAITVEKKSVQTHRLSWFLETGEWPGELDVLHKCDNPPCVRPSHLFLGTQSDNARDMVSKDRNYVPDLHCETHPLAKITNDDVLRIRTLRKNGYTGAALGKIFGLTKGQINRICNGQGWGRVHADLITAKKQTRLLTADQATEIRVRNDAGETQRSLALAYGVHFGSINDVIKRKTWKHVP